MAGDPNTLIVLGSSPDSYYIGHGRRHFVENMPESFMTHAKTDLNVTMTPWISVSKTLDTWVSYNTATAKFHFNANIHQELRDHFSGTNGKASIEFASFPDDEDSSRFFVKGKTAGAWSATLKDYFIQQLTEKKAGVPGFDEGITGMLFGKGKTYIIMFRGGFLAEFDDDEVSTEDHPLYKVLAEHADGWCIERGSTLCFYDSKYFYLKFKKPGESRTMMHWNLPPNMAEKFQQLREEAQKPEEQIARMQDDQMWMQVAQTRMNGEMQMNNMLVHQMNMAALSMRAAATGGTIVYY